MSTICMCFNFASQSLIQIIYITAFLIYIFLWHTRHVICIEFWFLGVYFASNPVVMCAEYISGGNNFILGISYLITALSPKKDLSIFIFIIAACQGQEIYLSYDKEWRALRNRAESELKASVLNALSSPSKPNETPVYYGNVKVDVF